MDISTLITKNKMGKCFLAVVLGSLFAVCAHGAEISEAKLRKIIEQTAQKTADEIVKKINASAANPPASGKVKRHEDNVSVTSSLAALDKNTRLMTIGSGAIGGNYYVLGELIGGVISHPVGSLPCNAGGTCGVDGVQTLNITTAGSMANLMALQKEEITSAFVQSDVAYWAYTGTGAFENKDKMSHIRAIASLYPEAVHIVINKKAGIKTVTDLKDKRVSIGARKSGTLSLARMVLDAYGMTEDDLQVAYLNNQQSIKQLKAGELDAMFFSVGSPAPALTQLFANSKDFTLLAIDKSAQAKIFKNGAYFSPFVIAADTYRNIGKTSTISVFALWLTTEKQDAELVYEMTKALWSDTSRQLLNSSYIGRQVNIDNSLKGIGIPLHEGARKYYNQIGKRY